MKKYFTKIQPPTSAFDIDINELWNYRELLYFFVWKNIKVKYKQTIVGFAWVIIQPLFTMIIFSLFFGKLAKIPSNGLPYPIFYYSALLPWTYFANSLNQATNIMVENQRVITKIYFPRILLPLSSVISGLLDFFIAFLILIIMMIYYGIYPSFQSLFFILFLLLAVLTSLAAGIWLSAFNALYRDVKYTIGFIIQFWLFASPVAYPSSIVPGKWKLVYGLNPMVGVIDGFRWALLGKGKPPDSLFLVSTIGVLIILITGIIYFQKIESVIADRV